MPCLASSWAPPRLALPPTVSLSPPHTRPYSLPLPSSSCWQAKDVVYVMGTYDSPCERHLYAVPLTNPEGGPGGSAKPVRLTTTPCMHNVIMDHRLRRYDKCRLLGTASDNAVLCCWCWCWY